MDTKDYKEIENLELGMHEEDEKNSWSSLWEPREFDNIVSYVITPMREKAIKNNISEDEYHDQINSSKFFLKHLAGVMSSRRTSFLRDEEDNKEDDKLTLTFTKDLSFHDNVIPKDKWNNHNSPIHFDSLIECFKEYKRKTYLHCNWLDWFFLNASLYNEYIISYDGVQQGLHRGVFAGINWRYVWSGGHIFKMLLYSIVTFFLKLILRWLLFPGLALYFFSQSYLKIALWLIGIWIVYMFFYLISVPGRIIQSFEDRKTDKKAHAQVEILAAACLASKDDVLNPSQIKMIMSSGPIPGGLYPSATFAIIDHIIERKPTYLDKLDYIRTLD